MTRARAPGTLVLVMTERSETSPRRERPAKQRVEESPAPAPARRFARTDGRFDLPVIVGRTPQQVARRLA